MVVRMPISMHLFSEEHLTHLLTLLAVTRPNLTQYPKMDLKWMLCSFTVLIFQLSLEENLSITIVLCDLDITMNGEKLHYNHILFRVT